jgi:hypothetical protein
MLVGCPVTPLDRDAPEECNGGGQAEGGREELYALREGTIKPAPFEDAPKPPGVTIDTLPLTPKHLRTLIRAAEARRPHGAE